MKSFYLTDAGKVRSHNEDSVIIVKNQNDDYLMNTRSSVWEVILLEKWLVLLRLVI